MVNEAGQGPVTALNLTLPQAPTVATLTVNTTCASVQVTAGNLATTTFKLLYLRAGSTLVEVVNMPSTALPFPLCDLEEFSTYTLWVSAALPPSLVVNGVLPLPRPAPAVSPRVVPSRVAASLRLCWRSRPLIKAPLGKVHLAC